MAHKIINVCLTKEKVTEIISKSEHCQSLGKTFGYHWVLGVTVKRIADDDNPSKQTCVTQNFEEDFQIIQYIRELQFSLARVSDETEATVSARFVLGTVIVDRTLNYSLGVKTVSLGSCNVKTIAPITLILRFEKDEPWNNIGCMTDKDDLVLKFNNYQVYANKQKLVDRSAVFHAMYENDDLKSGTPEVAEISELKMEDNLLRSSVQAMVNYLYEGKVDIATVEQAGQLIYLADAYVIKGLKQVAVDYLSDILTCENAIEIQKLTDELDLPLKKTVDLLVQHNKKYFIEFED